MANEEVKLKLAAKAVRISYQVFFEDNVSPPVAGHDYFVSIYSPTTLPLGSLNHIVVSTLATCT